MGFCSCTIKFMLILFNLICAMGGIAILVIGIVSNNHGGSFKSLINGQVTTASICLMVLGSVVFLIAFFGCCGALREDTCMIQTYAVLLLIILIAEVAIGVTAFVFKGKVENGLQHAVEDTFSEYYRTQDAKDTVDEIQKSLHCCGYSGPVSWMGRIPDSCCPAGTGCTMNNSYMDGCYDKIRSTAKNVLAVIGGVAIGIAVIELIGVIGAFYVASTIRDQERRGYI